MNKNHTRVLFPLALLLAGLLALAGCRPSTALTQLRNASVALNPSTEDMLTNDEEDEDSPDESEPVDEQSDDAQIQEEDITIGQFMEDLLEDETTADQALQAIYDTLAESDEWGTQTVNTEDTQDADETEIISTTTEGDTIQEDSEQTGGDLNSEAEETSGVGENTSEGSNESTIIQANDNEDPSDETSGGSNDDESSKQLVNPDGEYVELEETEGKVAATGQLAILVSMLGGADRLCATSEDYDENELAQKAFSGGDYEVLWSGDGSSPMSEDDFQTLLSLNPGLCVELSGYNTFSESQIEQLEEAGVTYAALPGFTSAEDIEQTVQLLGTLLGDTSEDGGTDAPAIAEDYLDWCAKIEKTLSKADTEAATTVFIEDWDEEARVEYGVQEYISVSSYYGYWTDTGRTIVADTGMAVIRIGSLFRPLSDYMAYSNVTDFSAQPYTNQYDSSTTVSVGSSGNSKSFGYLWQEYTSANENRPGQTLSGQLCYISPLRNYFYGTVSNRTYFWSTGQLVSGSMASEIINASSSYSNSLSLGSVPNLGAEGFTIVIARDSETAQSLADSLSWQTNKTTGTITATTAVGNGSSDVINALVTKVFLPDTDAIVSSPYAYSNLSGSYEIYVNPTGLGDWVDGSPESILEAVWIAWRVQGCYETQEDVEKIIQDFYETFYHYTLSESEMAAILAGPATGET
ncbi:MAG: hypothetical protein LUF68_06220 [Clostridiales bacterium]|nr:hypothetical protein [Clostridiales bacterium]